MSFAAPPRVLGRRKTQLTPPQERYLGHGHGATYHMDGGADCAPTTPGSSRLTPSSVGKPPQQQGLTSPSPSASPSPSPSPSSSNPSLYKTELCRSFRENGSCRYGSKCQFAHGIEELRPVVRHPKYKTEICKTFHSLGTCPYGERCRFIHDFDEGGVPHPKPSPQTHQSKGGGKGGQSLNPHYSPQPGRHPLLHPQQQQTVQVVGPSPPHHAGQSYAHIGGLSPSHHVHSNNGPSNQHLVGMSPQANLVAGAGPDTVGGAQANPSHHQLPPPGPLPPQLSSSPQFQPSQQSAPGQPASASNRSPSPVASAGIFSPPSPYLHPARVSPHHHIPTQRLSQQQQQQLEAQQQMLAAGGDPTYSGRPGSDQHTLGYHQPLAPAATDFRPIACPGPLEFGTARHHHHHQQQQQQQQHHQISMSPSMTIPYMYSTDGQALHPSSTANSSANVTVNVNNNNNAMPVPSSQIEDSSQLEGASEAVDWSSGNGVLARTPPRLGQHPHQHHQLLHQTPPHAAAPPFFHAPSVDSTILAPAYGETDDATLGDGGGGRHRATSCGEMDASSRTLGLHTPFPAAERNAAVFSPACVLTSSTPQSQPRHQSPSPTQQPLTQSPFVSGGPASGAAPPTSSREGRSWRALSPAFDSIWDATHGGGSNNIGSNNNIPLTENTTSASPSPSPSPSPVSKVGAVGEHKHSANKSGSSNNRNSAQQNEQQQQGTTVLKKPLTRGFGSITPPPRPASATAGLEYSRMSTPSLIYPANAVGHVSKVVRALSLTDSPDLDPLEGLPVESIPSLLEAGVDNGPPLGGEGAPSGELLLNANACASQLELSPRQRHVPSSTPLSPSPQTSNTCSDYDTTEESPNRPVETRRGEGGGEGVGRSGSRDNNNVTTNTFTGTPSPTSDVDDADNPSNTQLNSLETTPRRLPIFARFAAGSDGSMGVENLTLEERDGVDVEANGGNSDAASKANRK